MVNLIGTDREFEIEQERLSVVSQTASSGLSDLSMERRFLSVDESDIEKFTKKKKNRSTQNLIIPLHRINHKSLTLRI